MSDADGDPPTEAPVRKPGKDTQIREKDAARIAKAEEDEDEARKDAKEATARAWTTLEKRAESAERNVRLLLALIGVVTIMTTFAAIGITAADGEIPYVGKLSLRSEENAPRAEGNEATDSGTAEEAL